MNKIFTVLLAAAASFALVNCARAQDHPEPGPGPYVAVGGGGDWAAGNSFDVTVNNSDHRLNTRWGDGWGAFAALGYRFDPNMRAELEFSERQAPVHSWSGNTAYGDQWDDSGMLNAFYDIRTGTAITPYVGGGIGAAHIAWSHSARAAIQALPDTYDDSGTKFAWQAIGGAAFEVTQNLALTADFRYKASTGYRFRSQPSGNDINHYDYDTRSAFLGVRYAF